jgi:hypothetical protein
MSKKSDQKSDERKLKIGKLQLVKESVQDLTEREQEAVKGGQPKLSTKPIACVK